MGKTTYCVMMISGEETIVRAVGPEHAFFQAAKKLRVDVSTEAKIDEFSAKVKNVILNSR